MWLQTKLNMCTLTAFPLDRRDRRTNSAPHSYSNLHPHLCLFKFQPRFANFKAVRCAIFQTYLLQVHMRLLAPLCYLVLCDSQSTLTVSSLVYFCFIFLLCLVCQTFFLSSAFSLSSPTLFDALLSGFSCRRTTKWEEKKLETFFKPWNWVLHAPPNLGLCLLKSVSGVKHPSREHWQHRPGVGGGKD